MGIIERLKDFESQSIQTIAYNMCKWFEFESVNIDTQYRDNVESHVWITIKITNKLNTFHISGQRNDIVKKRLIEWLTLHLNNNKS